MKPIRHPFVLAMLIAAGAPLIAPHAQAADKVCKLEIAANDMMQ